LKANIHLKNKYMDETYEIIKLFKKRDELMRKMMKVAEENGITDDAGLVELEEYKEFKKVEDELKKLYE